MNDQASPGWYPNGGGLRYWDGSAWTEHFQADGGDPAPKGSGGAGQAISGAVNARASNIKNAAGRIKSAEMDLPEGTLWSAVGKGLGGITTGRYSLNAEYLHFEKGTLSTAAQQVYAADIYNADVKQSMTQKARGVYTVIVHVAGRTPVLLEDVPDGSTAQRIIIETGRQAKLIREHRNIQIDGARHEATNTTRQEIAYGGTPPGFAPSVPVPGLPMVNPTAALAPVPSQEAIDAEVVESPAVDPIAQIKELAALRDAGILTEDEFSAKKAEILSRM